ncbi:glutathione S-transferase N-terminal domain-containing protein [Acinetobacter towneri]|jgi:RNA polymerase-associated protein|uniref:glutathione S-transferase N-terminal domain-containing protein n=1 Tax=Acinetobacter TaxID=469 RepID=UPI0015D1E5B2|nr:MULTISPECIES: glutathione S-transferase N-terminal domain-containing protein [Acinetobacter]MCA4780631.1 glutathione S-transferase N-terminal domain-containing protein [Acinetobacter towneri]MCA4785951.1 glutathione S-transferase N-terminal domain-containing protein [Acinetobacter towneri]MCA4788042.1 glutathione S-transferase N-terminal domain-containing protein [Acinetobacter towneri]MCA4797098.1 glutathione S-transferase N-terminal domain-containing protein [Acinetobacter towneri]MCA4802
MSVENAPLQGITLYSHADDFRSHWIRYVLAEKQIKYQLILVDHEDEDLASLNPYNQLPILLENDLKLFNSSIISEYLDDRYRQNKLYADAPMPRAEQRQYIWRFEQDWFKLADDMLCHPDSLNPQAQRTAQKQLRDTLISLTPLFQHYPFFMSETFNILDCMLAPLFIRLKAMGIELPKQHCRPIFLYCQRIFNRPAFLKSMTLQEKSRYQEFLIHT